MAVALVDYQEQTSRYNALIMKASQRGFELFESKLAAREEPGRQIDSLRALYDLWVDAAEEAYAEIALSPEFREVYGALVNAQMRVRSQIQQEVERIATRFRHADAQRARQHRAAPARLAPRSAQRRRDGFGRTRARSRRAASRSRRVEGRVEATTARRATPRRRSAGRRAPRSRCSASARVRPRRNACRRTSRRSARRHQGIGAARPVRAKRTSPAPKATAPRRARRRARAHAQRPTSPPRAKKSVAKVAHTSDARRSSGAEFRRAHGRIRAERTRIRASEHVLRDEARKRIGRTLSHGTRQDRTAQARSTKR